MDAKIILGALTFLLSEWGVEPCTIFPEAESARIVTLLDAMDELSDEEYTQKVIELAQEYGRNILAGAKEAA